MILFVYTSKKKDLLPLMINSPDSNPALAVRVVPAHRERWDKVGRLYRKPDFILPEDFRSLPVLKKLILNGDLVPSITNVIDVKGSPYLVDWAAKMVAEEGIRLALRFPQEIAAREEKAFKYLKNMPHEYKTFWGSQGTNVHNVAELIALEQDISAFTLTEYESGCVNSFRNWLDDFQPTFNYTEITGFGKTSDDLGFAGTADWHITIKGVNILGDTKCTTDDTLILLKDGSQKFAKDIKVGDEVVSWSEEEGLRVDKVAYVGDNGFKKTYTIFTEFGHAVTVTGNHQFLKRGVDGMTWLTSDKLTPEDTVYTVSGWSHSPFKTENEWLFNKHLSPYLLGLLWALAHHNPVDWTDSGKVSFPATARAELLDELADFGFLKSADNRIRVKTGLRRVANKTKYREDEKKEFGIDDLLSLVNSVYIPDFVFSSPLMYQTAFMSGVQEVFANKSVNEDYFFVEHRNLGSLQSLQQLYANNGQSTKIGMNPKTNHPVLRLPIQSGEQVHVYGLEEAKVVRVRENPEPVHTVAIEVENTHNHVTGGVLTHNTNKTGLHSEVSLQLAANRNVESISPDGMNLVEPMKSDITAALHLSPNGYLFQEVFSGEEAYQDFEALRKVWGLQAFEGNLYSEPIFGRKFASVSDI
jgi:hypothetical protein